ncbi:hypothetical protein ACS0TY_025923 [Phlomoides rotata]
MRELKEVFPPRLRKLWNSIELRVLVLLSLLLQIVLISTGNRRKYIRKKWLGVILWLCYLSADVVATIALGVLSQASGDDDAKSEDQHSYAIMGFWAPFLLMHLGGPDSITAYALADNELWSRHFLALIGQVAVAVYVLLRSWISTPVNYLWFVIFTAGFLKYGERTLVLFWASRDRFRKGMVSPPDPGPNYAKFMDEFLSKKREGYDVSLVKVIDEGSLPTPTDSPEHATVNVVQEAAEPQGVTAHSDSVVQDAYPFFLTFKKLFADLILSFQDKETSLSKFRELSWDKAFGIVEVELGFIYDLFYTKASLLYSARGSDIRILSWSCTVAAFIAFVTIDKNAYPKTEVIITYILLIGAILIEIYAVIIFFRSDWISILLSGELPFTPQRRKFPSTKSTTRNWTSPPELTIVEENSLPDSKRKLKDHIWLWLSYLLPARLRWSNSMGQYNVLDRCIERKPHIICWYLKEYLFWNGKNVPKSLKKLIFDEVKKRDKKDGEDKSGGDNTDKKLGTYRGDKILLQKMDCLEKIDEVEFDQSVLLWHMATEFCYHTGVDENNKPEETWLYKVFLDEKMISSPQDILKFRREISVLISNYMVHLLITSPFMLPSGIGQIRFQDTRAEAIEFFDGQKNISRSEACNLLLKVDTQLLPSKVKGDRSKSLLFDACRLAQSLRSQEVGDRWEKITQAWLDILTFAAAQCKWNDHAEKLSQGGELLTHVWLLMAHFGMTDQFQISQGYERVKLNLK